MVNDNYNEEQTTTGRAKSETVNPYEYKNIGWVCPVCGSGLSPFTAICPCRNNGRGWEVTCNIGDINWRYNDN